MLTYLDFLILFIFLPIIAIALLHFIEARRNNKINAQFQGMNPIGALFALSFIALAYTTLWDNYLVATGVWFYELDQILGIILGFVPLEEYLFFIAQPFLVGAVVIWGQRYYRENPSENPPTSRNGITLRMISLIPLAIIWIVGFSILLVNIPAGRYFALIVVWAFPPIILQLAYGADILWKNRKIVIPSILLPSLYLSAADAYAISEQVWTIAPETSLGFLIGGVLPFEEMLFFFVTNILIVFGITLLLDVRGKKRLNVIIHILKNDLINRFMNEKKRKSVVRVNNHV